MEFIGIFSILITLHLIQTFQGVFLVGKNKYKFALNRVLSNTLIFGIFLLPVTTFYLQSVSIWIISESVLPLLLTATSFILSFILLRDHFVVIILPAVMCTIFLFLFLFFISIFYISQTTGNWILGVLLNEVLLMNFLGWGSVCLLLNYILSTFFSIYIGFKKEKLSQCMKYKKENRRVYLYVASLPSAVFLFFWFQYSALDPILVDNIIGVIIYFLLLIVCAASCFFMKYKIKTKSKLRICIYIAVNLILAVYLTENTEYESMTWLFSYYVSCFIALIFYEVKISRQVTVTEKSESTKVGSLQGNMWTVIISYVPLIAMVVSNLIILACNRAYLFY